MKKILAVGNALVDMLIRIEAEGLLDSLNLPRGCMTLIDEPQLQRIQELTATLPRQQASGGSAANTVHGLASLGVPCGYIGMVGNDTFGRYFLQDLTEHGIRAWLPNGTRQTGRCVSLISPDGERTMATFLGAAIELAAENLNPDLFSGYDLLHIEGYLVQNHPLIERALQLAKAAGLEVSLDLSSANVVRDNLAFLHRLVERYVDIVFANEDETAAFTGKSDPREALIEISPKCKLAVIKIGRRGSLVQQNQRCYPITCQPAEAVDTTGAGDLYASGFLYGLSRDFPLETCGRIGSLVAARVVEVIGARMDQPIWNAIKTELAKLDQPA